MLCKSETLTGYKLNGLDGEIGRVSDFYFDDRYWTIRYLVANTGNWLTGRAVLISPYSLLSVSATDQNIAINLTKEQIENSPPLESAVPISKQFEENYYSYYGWPMYWAGPNMWGEYPSLARGNQGAPLSVSNEKHWTPHLRSVGTVSTYKIQGSDGEIGHVSDFIVDDETWVIRYLLIDTRNWWPGKRVLISPRWIERVSWEESTVFVNLSCASIKGSPEFNDDILLRREYEQDLHDHYQREGYWVDELDADPVTKKPATFLY